MVTSYRKRRYPIRRRRGGCYEMNGTIDARNCERWPRELDWRTEKQRTRHRCARQCVTRKTARIRLATADALAPLPTGTWAAPQTEFHLRRALAYLADRPAKRVRKSRAAPRRVIIVSLSLLPTFLSVRRRSLGNPAAPMPCLPVARTARAPLGMSGTEENRDV